MDKRKPNRLPEFDYSQNGAYFITICTRDKQKIFWIDDKSQNSVGADIIRPHDKLNDLGLIVECAIEQITEYYPNTMIDKYVIMPNHVHILMRIENDEFNGRIISAPTISIIIGQMKRWVSKQIAYPIWQKSFHDHVIRDEEDYRRIWQYIDTNPVKWEFDCYYTE